MPTVKQLPPAAELSNVPAASPVHTAPVASVRAALTDAPEENEIAGLLEAAEKAEQKRRTVERVNYGSGAVTTVLFPVWLLSMTASLFFSSTPANLLLKTGFVFVAVNGFIRTFFLNVNGIAPEQQKRSATRLLAFPHESRLLLPLLDSLRALQIADWKNAVYPLLTERLWNLSPNDAALSLDEPRRATLRQFLGNAYAFMPVGKRKVIHPDHFDDATADLAVAVIKTLAGIGDAKTVKVLQKIIKARAETPNETVVRDAAREYLPALQQKITENTNFRLKVQECMGKTIMDGTLRDPQTMLAEFTDTLSPEDAKVALVEFLRVQTHRNLRRSAACYAGAFGLFTLICVVGFGKMIQDTGLSLSLTTVFSVAINLLVIYGRNFRSTQEVQRAACELSRRVGDDTRITALLLKAAQNGLRKPEDDAVKKALVRLLPQLKPGDAALVPPTQRAYLRSWLNPRCKQKDAHAAQTLAIAALDALAALGDTKALPKAEKIARQTVGGTLQNELHQAALRCVEALQKRPTGLSNGMASPNVLP